MKKLLLATALMFTVPAAANAQSDWFSSANPTYQGFYIGAQGGLNWLLNNQSYVMDTGWTAGTANARAVANSSFFIQISLLKA